MIPWGGWAAEIGRYYAVLIVAASILAKIRKPALARLTLSGLAPRLDHVSHHALIGVVAAEMLILGLLVMKPQPGLLATAAMLVAFAGLIIAAVWRREHVLCACLGNDPRPLTWFDAARNLLAAIVCLVSAWYLPVAGAAGVNLLVAIGLAAIAFLMTVHASLYAELVRA